MFEDIYRKLDEVRLAECGGTGTVYEHRKTGARVFTLKNEDPNKVFMIGFRTTPADSTGVAHIMEHSVLCGSEKFPLKDPFVELAKGSLNTFLNAMTYPDKTVYPVASCNEKDFMNLCDVYLDAVLHPDIYRVRNIFLQEGWHYETDAEGKLSINGVVYNEMKGVFSSPDSVLERYTMNALFPHTTYGNESGGDPDCIPDLTYEAFLEFHKKYYHPSNSYIYLYGDMDMEEKLLWIDSRYLNAYERAEIDSAILPEPAFEQPVFVEKSYPVTDSEETEGKAFLSENFVIPEVEDSLTDLAWEVIDFVLLSAPGAPLKEELIRRGFGEEVYGGYSGGIRQPYFSVIAKNCGREKLEEFRACVREILEKTVKEGFDEVSLRAALNYMEFKYREEDFGRTPAGLEYGLTAMEAWLYDRKPWLYLTYDREFEELNRLVGTDFYEKLLAAAVLDNPHAAEVVCVPERGMTERKDRELAEKLEVYRNSLSKEEYEAICRQEKELNEWQETEDSEEAKRCLPVLAVSDIGPNPEKIVAEVKNGVIYSDLPTNGIAYMRLNFDLSGLTERELQLAAFVRNLYGELNTSDHTFKELSDEILLKTGGVSFLMGSQALDVRVNKDREILLLMTAEIRTLKEHIGDGIGLAFEMLEKTLFDDEQRIVDKLLEMRSGIRSYMEDAGHLIALNRARSYTEKTARFTDLINGVEWYDFLNQAAKDVKKPEKRHAFVEELRQMAEKLCRLPFEPVLSGSQEMLEEMDRILESSGRTGKTEPFVKGRKGTGSLQLPGKRNEGFRTGSMVNYVARTGSCLKDGMDYDGSADVLKVLLNYEYLWNNLRVKGGAYGCSAGFTYSGKGWFVSYRDPGLEETNRTYEEFPEWLEKTPLSQEKIDKYIIGAIAAQDQPVTVSVRAQRQAGYYYSQLDDPFMEEQREQILHCTPEKLKAHAELIRSMLEDGSICVVGGTEKINGAGALFRNVRDLK